MRHAFGQPPTEFELLQKFSECAQAGLGLDLATGECCEPDECIQGWKPGQPIPEPPGGRPNGPPKLPGVPTPPGMVLIKRTELDELEAEQKRLSSQRIWVGAIAGGAGLALGGVIGYALSR